MIIQNALVFTEDFLFEKKNLYIRDRYIAEEAGADEEIVNAEGLYAIPGLIDIHLHGCAGFDFCDGTDAALSAMAAYEAQNGITAFAPASMTLPEETLLQVFRTAVQYSRQDRDGAMFCGINMEGPFFSPEKKGAQNGAYLQKPDLALFHRLQNAADGRIKLVDIAPELEGALPFIKAAAQEVNVSVAHTAADYQTARQAFAAGARHVTHLYNAMPPFSHRAPGVVGAACDAGAAVELICDGVHVHESMIRATWKLFGNDRVVLISDSMRAAGLQDGCYTLGGQEVTVRGSHATLSDGTIAGSVTNLFDCMRKAVSFGIPLECAVRAATYNPACEIGEEARMGTLSAGKLANVVLLDRALNLRAVYIAGRQVSLPA